MCRCSVFGFSSFSGGATGRRFYLSRDPWLTKFCPKKMASAAKRIKRLKRIDRAAVFIITRGLGVVVGVLGMLVFIAAEAVPMFRAATLTPHKNVGVTGEPATGSSCTPVSWGPLHPTFRPWAWTSIAATSTASMPTRASSFITSTATTTPRGLPPVWHCDLAQFDRQLIASGWADGRVALAQPIFTPQDQNEALSGLDVKILERGVASLEATGRAIRQVTDYEDGGRKYVAAIVGDTELALWRTDDAGRNMGRRRSALAGERLLHVRIGRNDTVIAASQRATSTTGCTAKTSRC